ncbi:hypothetical protein KL906_002284 [Ogataea polymorpha]|nr:hypothetical protein KL906_002284 [Ogataea polymorpha]
MVDTEKWEAKWSSEGSVTEYTADAKAVSHSFLEWGEFFDKIQNYRHFKFDWHGYPSESVAVLSEISDDDEIIISLNGHTETKNGHSMPCKMVARAFLARQLMSLGISWLCATMFLIFTPSSGKSNIPFWRVVVTFPPASLSRSSRVSIGILCHFSELRDEAGTIFLRGQGGI